MANVDAPFGLRPVGHLLGLSWTDKVRPYYVPAGYATALFIGDPVIKVAGGSNTAVIKVPGAGSFGTGTLPEINKAAAGATNRITGVIVGFSPLPTNLDVKHNPASTERVAHVCEDPYVIFAIQADSAGLVPAANIGVNANLIFTHAGVVSTGLSGVELNSSTEAADATFQLLILRAVNVEDNDGELAHARFEVLINLHTQNPVAALGIA